MPTFLKRALRIRHGIKELQRIQRAKCDVKYLKSINEVDLKELFSSHQVEMEWDDIQKRIKQFGIPDGTDGVNPGDRRAIYYLIRGFKPTSVLEIGTHIGASTIHIAAALSQNQISEDTKQPTLVSVDIRDVNDLISKPWLKYGAKHSPIEMINKMELEYSVDFVTDTSLDYFAKCERKYDFVFLDGDHAVKTVYQEIPAALKLLNKDGLILLHDYFPNLEPLWSNGSVIPGPFLATERLKDEGVNLVVLPLGELPWPTKLQSNITSLALLLLDFG
jgi:predicted O-methyltransferase YrrM